MEKVGPHRNTAKSVDSIKQVFFLIFTAYRTISVRNVLKENLLNFCQIRLETNAVEVMTFAPTGLEVSSTSGSFLTGALT